MVASGLGPPATGTTSEEEEDDTGFRHVGVEIVCTPDVADGIAQQPRDAVDETLEGYSDDEIIDYGVD
ncbi:cytochrome c-type biogenesis protein [Actinacidiphila bryophytorum]|uniref:hypothetical protein n=1 Tax=Actinacidiphila bryophytorum TaxID=1436133 RepID=UPI002176B64F|nr:hypothetical protein [Actinacidiphila bryophytorum]UWE10215.1 hypothetical protein NYE86_16840 [Actinacidiphila bryophytorum]